MSDMGRVEFGAEEDDDGMHRPYISIDVGEPTNCIFQCNVKFNTIDGARTFIVAVERILRGERKNYVYDRNGDA